MLDMMPTAPTTLQMATRRIVSRRFGAALAERWQLPVEFADEGHTSQEAARRFAGQRAAGLKRRKDAASIDAEAAAVILESWLAQA